MGKRLCRDCKHKGRLRDEYSPGAIFYCKIHSGDIGRYDGLFINPGRRKPEPLCPLQTGDLSPEGRRMYKRRIPL